MSLDPLWQACCTQLAAEIPTQQFTAWIKPLHAPNWSSDGAVATLSVPNRFKMDWLRSQYAERISLALAAVAGRPVQLEFAIHKAAAPRPTQRNADDAPAASPAAGAESAAAQALADGAAQASAADSAASEALERSRLNPGLSFDSLVAGKANQLARAAALQVAENPGKSYNPLFLYGGVGLGKTHLVQAVGNALLAQRPGAAKGW